MGETYGLEEKQEKPEKKEVKENPQLPPKYQIPIPRNTMNLGTAKYWEIDPNTGKWYRVYSPGLEGKMPPRKGSFEK